MGEGKRVAGGGAGGGGDGPRVLCTDLTKSILDHEDSFLDCMKMQTSRMRLFHSKQYLLWYTPVVWLVYNPQGIDVHGKLM